MGKGREGKGREGKKEKGRDEGARLLAGAGPLGLSVPSCHVTWTSRSRGKDWEGERESESETGLLAFASGLPGMACQSEKLMLSKGINDTAFMAIDALTSNETDEEKMLEKLLKKQNKSPTMIRSNSQFSLRWPVYAEHELRSLSQPIPLFTKSAIRKFHNRDGMKLKPQPNEDLEKASTSWED